MVSSKDSRKEFREIPLDHNWTAAQQVSTIQPHPVNKAIVGARRKTLLIGGLLCVLTCVCTCSLKYAVVMCA